MSLGIMAVLLCWVSFMVNVTNKPFRLSVVMQNAVKLGLVAAFYYLLLYSWQVPVIESLYWNKLAHSAEKIRKMFYFYFNSIAHG